MKNRIHFLAFLGIFILLIIPKNVFAEQILPYSVTINSTALSSFGVSNNNRISQNINYNSTFALNIAVESFDYQTSDNSFNKYPYVFIYFITWNTQDKFEITKQSSCTSSCLASDGAFLKQVGTDLTSGKRSYIIAFKTKKWTSDCGTGSGQCVYHIDDVINIKNTREGDARNFAIYSVLLSDSLDILNNSSIDIDSMISNATTNTNSIINNQNSNAQNIINNQNSNTSDILQNDRQNTTNIIQNQNTNQSQTNEKLDNVNNTMKDESGVSNNDVSSKTTEWSNKLAGTGPVSQMVLMPITLLNGYVTGFNSTCSPYNLGSLYGTNIILPCISISNYLGTSLWGVIDILISGFMIFAMGKKFVKIFNDFTNLRDNQMDELYGGGK